MCAKGFAGGTKAGGDPPEDPGGELRMSSINSGATRVESKKPEPPEK